MTTVLATIEDLQTILMVKADGDFGQESRAAWGSLARASGNLAQLARVEIQQQLHVAEDGVFGELTQQALQHLLILPAASPWPLTAPGPAEDGWHHVLATSFADPQDVARFRQCKLAGGSDAHCLTVGDNGVGKWGDDCATGDLLVALPPEYWAPFGHAARLKLVDIQIGGKTLLARLGDTMPHLANITNDAGLDTNPGVGAAAGLRPPYKVPAAWRWAEAGGQGAGGGPGGEPSKAD